MNNEAAAAAAAAITETKKSADLNDIADSLFESMDMNKDGNVGRDEMRHAAESWSQKLLLSSSSSIVDSTDENGGEKESEEKNTPPQQQQQQQQQNTKTIDDTTKKSSSSSIKNGATTDTQLLLPPRSPGLESESLSFVTAFTSSTAMILATEIGDKTFFIAAVMSMKNDRIAVFSGAIMALICMTVLSTMMGMVLPNLVPRQYTHIIGGLLFLYFGIKLIIDSTSMDANKVSDELEEVEEELLSQSKKKEEGDDAGNGNDDVNNNDEKDSGVGEDVELAVSALSIRKKKSNKPMTSSTTNNNNNNNKKTTKTTSTASSPLSWENVFIQSLTLTFLAEWGDRSQIATIALAAAKEPWGVTIGGCFGHSICTGMAVIGGRLLASRISEKTVSLFGGMIFIVFGLHSLFFEV